MMEFFSLVVIKNEKKYSKLYYSSKQLVVYTSNTMTIVKVTFDFRFNRIRISNTYRKILPQTYRYDFYRFITLKAHRSLFST